jgi:hypothetical protein
MRRVLSAAAFTRDLHAIEIQEAAPHDAGQEMQPPCERWNEIPLVESPSVQYVLDYGVQDRSEDDPAMIVPHRESSGFFIVTPLFCLVAPG